MAFCPFRFLRGWLRQCGPPCALGLLPGLQGGLEPLQPVPAAAVELQDELFAPRIEINRRVSLPALLERCIESGHVANFARAGGLEEGQHSGRPYADAHVYRWLEAAAHSIARRPDARLAARAGELIELIETAQEDDGYLNTYVQLEQPKLRWADIQHGFELYCVGALVEAAIAWFDATGERRLLEVAQRLVELVETEFGPGRRLDPPGYPGLERALFDLARVSAEARYAALARFFLEQRGIESGRDSFGEFCQDHEPLALQREARGHAARAMSLYLGLSELTAASSDRTLLTTAQTLWQDVVRRKTYVTGGIGSGGRQRFGRAYELPSAASATTCAALGLAQWNHRMFLLTRHATFADAFERSLYNHVLAGSSHDGRRFFAESPLESLGAQHRLSWFEDPCGPVELARFLPTLSGKVYAHDEDDLYVLMYVESRAELELGGRALKVEQKTRYPWDGAVEIVFDAAYPVEFTLHLRVPGWCERKLSVGLEGAEAEIEVTHGDDPGVFLSYERVWKPGETVRLELPLEPQRVRADRRVEAGRGRVALQRGPLIYCLEAADNPAGVRNLLLESDATLSSIWRPELLGGAVTLRAKALTFERDGHEVVSKPSLLEALPFFLWDNRSPGEMRVRIPELAQGVVYPGEAPRLEQEGVVVRASHCNPRDRLAALNDGRRPRRSSDMALRRMTFLDHEGSAEWLRYDFDPARALSSSRVYWFADGSAAEEAEDESCRAPARWSLSWYDGEQWRPVDLEPPASYGLALDGFNAVQFEPVLASSLRLDLELSEGASAGVLEWEVAGP